MADKVYQSKDLTHPSTGVLNLSQTSLAGSQASPSLEDVRGSKTKESFGRSADTQKHVRLQEPQASDTSLFDTISEPRLPSIYLGSFGRSPRRTSRSGSRSRRSIDVDSRNSPHYSASAIASPRASVSHSFKGTDLSAAHLAHLLENLNLDLETYGVEEYRDGFFDASFFKPKKQDDAQLLRNAEVTLPATLRKRSNPLSLSAFLLRILRDVQLVATNVVTTRAGVKLSKSFLAFFIAYILCLVPVIGYWLGPVSYVMPLSAIINHPGRPIGAQLDGFLLTIAGTATGLGWGAFALYISDISRVSQRGYGGVLATFLILFLATMAAMRSYFIRSYQYVLTAGVAVLYTCLDHTTEQINWDKLFDWGIPWVFGQVIAVIICCSLYPDAGARPLAVVLHDAFKVMMNGLTLPRSDDTQLRRTLTFTFVNLSQAYRDLSLDISITKFRPNDILELRNRMQAVIRSLLSLKVESDLFELFNAYREYGTPQEPMVDVEGNAVPSLRPYLSTDEAVQLVVNRLAEPIMDLLVRMAEALQTSDAVLLTMSSYQKYLGPPYESPTDVVESLTCLRRAMTRFDDADDHLTDNPSLPSVYADHEALVRLFLFVNPIRQLATPVEALLVQVMAMQDRKQGWRLFFPSYPLSKGLQRTNAQVRHDRGGATAGFFFRSQKQLARQLQHIQKSTFRPSLRDPVNNSSENEARQAGMHDEHEVRLEENTDVTKATRYRLWLFLRGLQGFEMRFALKVIIVTTLLSVPAWLEQSREWYSRYECWWAVIFVWLMMHPRVGGNFQDLVTRSLTALLGVVWAGFAYAAKDGNPYVMAVFAAILMLPMMYRFTQSSHPRSGLIGCISFTVVSLKAYNNHGRIPIVTLAWTQGVSYIVGISAAVIVNWILFPFVARHELRKSLSSMLLHLAIVYRGIVAKYIYYTDGQEPSIEDVSESELLEGRLREGFVRIRQLMALTRHEIRLRGPFDPAPYSALIEGCEAFFSHLVEVRQSSLYFSPNYMSHSLHAQESLLPYRRDAVASILINLYCLAGALRGRRPIPRYLPSAAAARKRLLDRMKEVEIEVAEEVTAKKGEYGMKPEQSVGKGAGRKYAGVYQFAYSFALTECTEELEQLKLYTRIICGEVGWDLDIYDKDVNAKEADNKDDEEGLRRRKQPI